jgi:FMN hydrolase / 5-amino-6-(5-phospho-D-ribitylamino)uracil phosphatase
VGIGQHFRAAFSAQELGVGKPDVRMFQAGAQAAGVAPHEVLHIGDDAHLDGVGALNAGMQVAWVNRAGLAWDHAECRPHVVVADLGELCRRLGPATHSQGTFTIR